MDATKKSDTAGILVDADPGTHWLVLLVLNQRSGQSHQTVMGPFQREIWLTGKGSASLASIPA